MTSFLYGLLELGNVEKNQSSDLSRSGNDKQDVTVHPKQVGVVSGKDAHAVKISDPPVLSQCIKKDSSNDFEDTDLFISVKNGNSVSESAEAVPTASTAMTCESDLRDLPRASVPDDCAPKVVCFQRKLSESIGDDSCKIIAVTQASGDALNDTPHGLQMSHNLCPPDNKLDKSDLKQEAFVDQSSALENPFRDIVIPEHSYIWQYDPLLPLLPLTSSEF